MNYPPIRYPEGHLEYSITIYADLEHGLAHVLTFQVTGTQHTVTSSEVVNCFNEANLSNIRSQAVARVGEANVRVYTTTEWQQPVCQCEEDTTECALHAQREEPAETTHDAQELGIQPLGSTPVQFSVQVGTEGRHRILVTDTEGTHAGAWARHGGLALIGYHGKTYISASVGGLLPQADVVYQAIAVPTTRADDVRDGGEVRPTPAWERLTRGNS